MITIEDCEAFCDADPDVVHEVACRECLGMVQAYARAHEARLCEDAAGAQPLYRRAVASSSDRCLLARGSCHPR